MQKVTGLAHLGVFTADREESVDFYTNILGFEVLFHSLNENNSGLYITMLQCGDVKLEILQPVTADPNIERSAGASLNHIGLACDDIEAVIKALRAHGVQFETDDYLSVAGFGDPPTDIEIIFFRGPSGERIELFKAYQ